MALSYLEMDKWSSDHASCEKDYRFIVELLNTRSYELKSSKKYDLLSAKIRIQLTKFEENISSLKQMLDKEYGLTKEERERRCRLVELLESSKVQLSQKFHSRGSGTDREALISSRGPGSASAGWASEDEDEEGDSQPLLRETGQQLREQQSRLMQDQSEGLERLSKVITRQKEIAVTIGNEVDLQNDLVDNIAERMDRTNSSIQRETTHVQVISSRDNTCRYWTVILILFIAIIIVAVL